MKNCEECNERQARIKTAKDGKLRCAECFVDWFEQVFQIHFKNKL